MLQLKDLRGCRVGEKVAEWDGKILPAKGARRRRGLKGLEGPRGGGAWFAGHGRIVPAERHYYSILVPYVNDYLQVVSNLF